MTEEKILKHKSIFKMWGFWLVVFLIIVVVSNANHKDSSPLTSSSPKQENVTQVTPTEVPKPTEDPAIKKAADKKAKVDADAKAKADALEKAPHLNEKAAVGNLEVAVASKIQTGAFIAGGSQNAQGIYWLLAVAVKNNDKKSRMIDSSMFQLISSDGSKYDPDPMTSLEANQAGKFMMQTINPGIATAGFVAFDMPTDKKPSDFILRVDSGVGFAAGTSVDFILKPRQ